MEGPSDIATGTRLDEKDCFTSPLPPALLALDLALAAPDFSDSAVLLMEVILDH